jgi:serine/threonine protein kinase
VALQAPTTGYVLRNRIGAGASGAVYLATQTSAAGSRLVAIKKVRDARIVDPLVRARLAAEGQLMFGLRHANICQILDVGESDAGTFLVMEYIPGSISDHCSSAWAAPSSQSPAHFTSHARLHAPWTSRTGDETRPAHRSELSTEM